jgi:hypothetical protein
MRTEIIRKLCHEKNLILGTDKESALYGGYQRIKFQPAGVVTGYETPDGRKIYYPAPAYTEEVKQSFFDVLSGIEPGRWWATTHPGMYKTKGDLTELLCDPRTLEIIKEKNIQLVSYADLWQEKYETVK